MRKFKEDGDIEANMESSVEQLHLGEYGGWFTTLRLGRHGTLCNDHYRLCNLVEEAIGHIACQALGKTELKLLFRNKLFFHEQLNHLLRLHDFAFECY